MEESKTKWNKLSYKEGFNMFSNDYFIDVSRKIPNNMFKSFIDELMKLLQKLTNPIKSIDKLLEEFIQLLLLLLMTRPECIIGATKLHTPIDKNTFTWANGSLNLLQNISNKTSNKIESFSLSDEPNLISTINSFMTNHPEFDDQIPLIKYYITQLNDYKIQLGRTPTSSEIFVFNNEFDNKLASDATKKVIHSIASEIPLSSYPNTTDGYLSYLKNTARFSFKNMENITFNFFNTKYFPFPMDSKGFSDQLKKSTNPDFIQKINEFLSFPSPSYPPPTSSTESGSIDPNYAYSINLDSVKIGTIKSYLKYVTLYYSIISFYNKNKNSSITFPTIETNVCMTYITYLNAIEFQKYRIHSTFLTQYELALFNHLFFICIQQNSISSNIYNIHETSNSMITNTPFNLYINLEPVSILNIVNIFSMEINNRIVYLSPDIFIDYQPLPLDGIIQLPINSTIDNSANIVVFLNEYILNNTDDKVIPSDDIINYYIPDGLNDCEADSNNTINEAKQYANVIKKEIYRMLTVPIIIYIFLNFYYLFFFKDCYSPVYITDDKGFNIYKHNCEGGEKGGCFTPYYLDWETIFHSIENHKTDYIFEFIFKPIKLIYTLLNSVKAIFRKEIFGSVIKDDVPYLLFLFSFNFIYQFIQFRGTTILNIMSNLIKFKIPDFKLYKKQGLHAYCSGVVIICFLMSFFTKITGITFVDVINNLINKKKEGGNKTEEGEYKIEEGEYKSQEGEYKSQEGEYKTEEGEYKTQGGKEKENEENEENEGNEENEENEDVNKPWGKWLIENNSGAFIFVFKCICFIIFWLFKFIISIGLVGLSKFIFIIYFIYNFLFGMSSFTTPIQSVNSKIDLIYRAMYTKLCDNDNDGIFKYIAKSFIFFCIYLLTECVIIHNLLKGVSSFSKMRAPKNSNTVNNSTIKSFIIIIYGLMIIGVVLWSGYKIQFRMPKMVSAYKNRPKPDDTLDKRFKYECSSNGAYEDESKNSFLNTFMNSDNINKVSIDEFNKKTEGLISPPFIVGFITQVGKYSEKIKENMDYMKEQIRIARSSSGKSISDIKESLKETVSGIVSNVKNIY